MPETGEMVRVKDKLLGTEFSEPYPFGGYNTDRYTVTQKKAVDQYGNRLPVKYDPLLSPTTTEPATAPAAKEATK